MGDWSRRNGIDRAVRVGELMLKEMIGVLKGSVDVVGLRQGLMCLDYVRLARRGFEARRVVVLGGSGVKGARAELEGL